MAVEVEPHVATNDTAGALAAAASGLGIAATTSWACRREVQAGELLARLEDDGSPGLRVLPDGTSDSKGRPWIALPFDIIFADKKVDSPGLQLADLVARPVGMSVLRPKQENRAFDVLTRKFYCSGGRAELGVGYEDWGLKIFPAP